MIFHCLQIRPEHIPRLLSEYGPVPDCRLDYRLGSALDKEDYWLCLLLASALNFCFWRQQGNASWKLIRGRVELRGLEALIACISELKQPGQSLLERCRTIKPADLSALTGSALPLSAQRAALMVDIANAVAKQYGGKVSHLFLQADYNAVALVKLLAATFPAFDDWAVLKGKRYPLHKKALVFAKITHYGTHPFGQVALKQMDQLPPIVDYRVPQLLRHAGVLQYGADLARQVDNRQIIAPGSVQEAEIRLAATEAIRLVRAHEGCGQANFIELDHWLWQIARRHKGKFLPHHRTLSIYY